MTIIIPDPITGPEITVTLMHNDEPVQVPARVQLLPQAKLIAFKSPFEGGGAKRRGKPNGKPEPLYTKKFKGPRKQLPDDVRASLTAMPYTQLDAFAKSIGTRVSNLSTLIREPSRGVSTGMLHAIMSGFEKMDGNTRTVPSSTKTPPAVLEDLPALDS